MKARNYPITITLVKDGSKHKEYMELLMTYGLIPFSVNGLKGTFQVCGFELSLLSIFFFLVRQCFDGRSSSDT